MNTSNIPELKLDNIIVIKVNLKQIPGDQGYKY